ncbi:hypothetical protein CHLNCDRAFT_51632 [Chlorella variabilis]|uniref:Serpin domain-containing protein n=1 Tax=Chlorella variabilis TaxID=554065 RepID=E1ZBF7_CHLVA|nr:hypothetical protein CHLNCDRAFT_51632 [Chlorella variabilis]EFN56639.1 hypothetical protein CHLNCDRAFT_51632 [Chlorella variabilis]|eukprot:XP_005848741.1 hypothetical protein CHLNCDRAFT_51632 [Chlorella variabilis]
MGSSPSTPASGDLAVAINAFGNSLFDKVVAEAKPGASAGIFLSPYGIAQALAMVLNGVDPGGDSYQQLQEVVFGAGAGPGPALDALNTQLKQLSTALVKEPTDDLTVSDANSAWLHQKYGLQAPYARALQSAFGAQAAPLTTAAAINAWVSEATRGKITGIVDDGAVSQAILILVNAVYFKALWQYQFKKASTFPADFHLLQHGAAPLQAATMFQVFKPDSRIQTAVLPATAAGGAALECHAVRLPYRGGEYYAVAAMPGGELSGAAAEGGGLGLVTPGGATVPYAQALAACRQALLSSLPQLSSGGSGNASGLWQVSPKDVKLFLPRQGTLPPAGRPLLPLVASPAAGFEVEFFASLNQSLQDLGVTKPFAGGDITLIAADSQGNAVGDLFVSDVLHKVYAKVDESGTEAAAVTAIVACGPELELRFDRPFAFAVVHGPTGLALFCGEVHKPEEFSKGL